MGARFMVPTRFDLSFPPFCHLTSTEKEALEKGADLLFFASGKDILLPRQKVDALYLVIKGIVGEMSADEVIGVYRETDNFDSRSLLTGCVENRFIAHEETLLYALPRQKILQAAENHPEFGAYFFARVSEKAGLSARSGGQGEWQNLFNATIREVGVRPAIFLDNSTSVTETARVMRENRCRSVFVRDHEKTGIFTVSHFRDILIEGIPGHAPIGTQAQYALHCCDLNDHVFSALLLMTRKNIHRVVVTEKGIPIGVLPQVDLLSFFSSHSHLISREIENATNLEGLVEAGRGIDAAIRTLNTTGMKTPQLARLVQALDLRLMERLWQLVAPPEIFSQSCLLTLGSGGRGEQLLKTDQDNALIFPESLDSQSVAQAAKAFCAGLLEIGYPPCNGGIMVNQPTWRGTLREWQARLDRWIYQPDGNTWIYLAAWLDAEVAAGNKEILHTCKHEVFERVRHETGWLGWLAKPIIQFDHAEAERHFWRQLLHRRSHAHFDIKKSGIFPIVHGVRVLALEAGIEPTNTFDRLRALHLVGLIDHGFAEDLSGALAFMMKLRLDHGLDAQCWGAKNDNQIDTGALSSLARDTLRESLEITRRFKAFICQHYQLGRF
jgi:CBS domain-containing protein